MPAELKLAEHDEPGESDLPVVLDHFRASVAQYLANQSSLYRDIRGAQKTLVQLGASEDLLTQVEAVSGALYNVYYELGLLVSEMSPDLRRGSE